MSIFSADFWHYMSGLTWLQGLTYVIVILVTYFIGKHWNKLVKRLRWNKRRSCGDCAVILIGKIADVLKRKATISHSILDEQMTYTEHKLEVIILDLLCSYKEDQTELRKALNVLEENKEYLLYKEGIQNAFALIKKEIRRAFRENGFVDKTGKEFSDYVKNKCAELISIGKRYMMSSYPSDDMIVPIDYLFNSIDVHKYEDITFEIFLNARDVRRIAEEKQKKIDVEFKKDIDNFIENNK